MRIFLLVLVLLLSAVPAMADLDQHCLSICVGNGQNGGDCMKQCSYNISATPKPAPIPAVTLESLEAHKTFSPLLPVGQGEVLPKPPTTPKPPKTDPICVFQCLHQHFRYDYCNEQCVKPTCAPGVILCKQAQRSFAPAP